MLFLILFIVAVLSVPGSDAFLSLTQSKPHHSALCMANTKTGVNRKRGPDSGKPPRQTLYVNVEDFYSDGWQLNNVVDRLKSGGIGVIPTDTCYSFVTTLSNRDGVEKLMRLKGGGKKPLSVLCKDLAMVDAITSDLTRTKWVFKLLKASLPGPYTFIVPAGRSIPKIVVDRKHHKLNKWRRKEIGVRIPDDSVVAAIMEDMHEPLLCGSVPEAGEDYLFLNWDMLRPLGSKEDDDDDDDDDDGDDDNDDDWSIDYHDVSYHLQEEAEARSWAAQMDFVVLNGPRGGGTADSLSTVVSLCQGDGNPPVVLRQGKGSIDMSKFM